MERFVSALKILLSALILHSLIAGCMVTGDPSAIRPGFEENGINGVESGDSGVDEGTPEHVQGTDVGNPENGGSAISDNGFGDLDPPDDEPEDGEGQPSDPNGDEDGGGDTWKNEDVANQVHWNNPFEGRFQQTTDTTPLIQP